MQTLSKLMVEIGIEGSEQFDSSIKRVADKLKKLNLDLRTVTIPVAGLGSQMAEDRDRESKSGKM